MTRASRRGGASRSTSCTIGSSALSSSTHGASAAARPYHAPLGGREALLALRVPAVELSAVRGHQPSAAPRSRRRWDSAPARVAVCELERMRTREGARTHARAREQRAHREHLAAAGRAVQEDDALGRAEAAVVLVSGRDRRELELEVQQPAERVGAYPPSSRAAPGRRRRGAERGGDRIAVVVALVRRRILRGIGRRGRRRGRRRRRAPAGSASAHSAVGWSRGRRARAHASVHSRARDRAERSAVIGRDKAAPGATVHA